MKPDACKIYRLKGRVQHYSWGGREFIPALLGVPNDLQQPFAEYWLGAHPSAPSVIADGASLIEVNQLLASHPELLGETVHRRFGQLPYLFKVLDVKEMLSIQVHPTREEAEIGFEEEELRGIAINAPARNYKDRNHKPEVMVALGDFWLLHGFRPEHEMKQTLNETAELRPLGSIFNEGGYQAMYSHAMELDQEKVDAMLIPVVNRELKRRSFHESSPDEPGYWVGEYYLNRKAEHIDKGIFSIYFLNLVQLQSGQGIYQAPGIPHAYLRGQNMELMANSDNVLRGGLTDKHIDVPELIKHTKFEAVQPKILEGKVSTSETKYEVPVDDFAISKIELKEQQSIQCTAHSAEIMVCLEGRATVHSANELEIRKGESSIVFAGNEYTIIAQKACTLFKASVSPGLFTGE